MSCRSGMSSAALCGDRRFGRQGLRPLDRVHEDVFHTGKEHQRARSTRLESDVVGAVGNDGEVLGRSPPAGGVDRGVAPSGGRVCPR